MEAVLSRQPPFIYICLVSKRGIVPFAVILFQQLGLIIYAKRLHYFTFRNEVNHVVSLIDTSLNFLR